MRTRTRRQLSRDFVRIQNEKDTQMGWLRRFMARRNKKDQTITLELSSIDWNLLQIEAEAKDWTIEKLVTNWIINRVHGTGVIGN